MPHDTAITARSAVTNFYKLKHCLFVSAASLKEAPVVGQMVISQYIDNNYYRVIVTKVQDDKITIAYIDFGNTEVTNIKKLKVLSDDLKQVRH